MMMMNRRLVSLCVAVFFTQVTGILFAQADVLLRGGDAQTSIRVPNRQNILKREKWQHSGRKPGNENSAVLRAKAVQQKLRMRATRPSIATSSLAGAWVSLGPSPLPSDASGIGLQDYNWVSGRATAVAIDPNDASGNTVFAGGAYGGVWKSSNAGILSPNPSGVTWTPLSDNQATLAIGSISVQPQASNPNPANSVVLAGTGETDSSSDSYYGLGILRSADGGQTWTLISQDAPGKHSFAGLGFSQIAFSTANPNLVVAATGAASQGILEGLEGPVGANRGLYYSTDSGSSWQMAVVSDASISISPNSATAVTYNAAASTFYAAVRFHGFYSSPDGANWTRLANQPGTGLTLPACPAQAASPSMCPIYRGEIAVVPNRTGPSNFGEMYAWYVDANDVDQGIWTSLDGGSSWTQINDSGITNCGDIFGGCGTENGVFNLTLAAVPDGAATDLYAGAANIYKCSITSAFPACNGSGINSFLNLTHVYGCSAIARVHPGQHAMSFAITNGAALLYFANDGGIYRALDGYTGLTTGTCGQANEFDSLNQTLGPLTQFVSLSESSSDPNVMVGGTQDNGAPATAFSQSGGNWVNVDTGDNEATAINPTNGDEWFVSTPPDSISGVNLFRCANGVGCHTADFQNNVVADSSGLDGDTGAFQLPFVLDPQNSNTLILGTCRIWRGPATGGSFSLLSPDFETGGTGSCSGNEINLVRSVAAGGIKSANGYSPVIYAGTDGEGPLISTTATGGHVWITTNADGGPLTWSDVTQSINPEGFAVSSIALDSADPLGRTAYVAIMGFHTSHVWKTTDAGASWTDFTANLPDAPANAIVVDSDPSLSSSMVYVGTDAGIFASNTGAANWTEVGPTSGQVGFLPNVAVTSLQVFNSGGLHRLRAGTYGRGIWEWDLIVAPDFQVNISNSPQTIFPAQTATFNGTIQALNGYSSTVNFSCTAGSTNPPQVCSVNPASVLPTTNVANFSVSAQGSFGDYEFKLHAAGTDSANATHDFPLTLRVVDFTLGTPSPSTTNANPGNPSSPVSFQVAALGSFTGSVELSCSNLPVGANCQFQPSSSVSPIIGNPVTVTLTIATSSTTPIGAYAVMISASTPGASAKTQDLTLVAGTFPDYSLKIANPSLTAVVNSSATFNGTVSAIDGYSSPVALGCGAGAPPTCTVNPANVTPISAGIGFTVIVSSNIARIYNFNIVALGGDAGSIAHSAAVSFTAAQSNFDFAIGVAPTSATIKAGQSPGFTVTVDPTTGSFPENVDFSCSGLPALSTCTFAPSQVGAGTGSTTIELNVNTEGPTISNSGTIPGTPAGTYAITITAISGTLTHTAELTLTVTAPSQNFDFNIGVSPLTATVAAGQAPAFTATVTLASGSFPGNVNFSCLNLPALTTCNFGPPQRSADSTLQSSTLTIVTTAPVAASAIGFSPWLSILPTVALIGSKRRRTSLTFRHIILLFALLNLSVIALSCSSGLRGSRAGSGSPGTPPGTYSVSVSATCGSITHTAPVSLTITP